MEGLQLDLGLVDDDDWFDTLVGINQRWLGSYARVNPSFGVNPSLLERNSLWMNSHFQKHRMITSPLSKQAKSLLSRHQGIVLMRLRLGGAPQHPEAEYSTVLVEPMAALMFAASVDRCPEYQIENMLLEAYELLQSRSLRAHALRSGFAGCVFRFLSSHAETSKRILTLQLLVLLANDDAAEVVQACKVAAQGQLWQPNMFIYTLQKRHHDNETIRDLAAELIRLFASEMPISSPIKIDSPRTEREEEAAIEARNKSSPVRSEKTYKSRGNKLPTIASPTNRTEMSPHRPTTTISSLYVDNPSPYSNKVILPIARPPVSASDQARRSIIYSTPKEKATAGDRKRRCLTPNIQESAGSTITASSDDLAWLGDAESPPKSPSSLRAAKKPVALSEKYSWNPDCINSVSGFEWWWRSLPQYHANLEPTQKLKMVTKAAVRLHTKGEWERAVELYLLALSMEINEEVEFRVRVNLGCAYEVGHVYIASEAEFKAALELNPDDPYARFKLGSALKELGRLDEARSAFESVLSVYPQAAELLKQVETMREQKAAEEAVEKAAIAAARTARSPSNPGRRLLSRGGATPSASLPQILPPSTPRSPSTSPRQPSPKKKISSPHTNAPSTDLVSCILIKCQEKQVDLRHTLRLIDTRHTGRIRLWALARLVSALCNIEVTTFHQWLPHDAVRIDQGGIVQYGILLDRLASDADKKRSQDASHTEQWETLIESIKLEEAKFYDETDILVLRASTNDTEVAEIPNKSDPANSSVNGDVDTGGYEVPIREGAVDSCADGDVDEVGRSTVLGNDGPSVGDVSGQTVETIEMSDKPAEARPVPTQDVEDEQNVTHVPAIANLSVARAEMDGYHAVSARLDEKREKARHEALLRAERSRVVARKHLHCLKGLQEVAAQARRHLLQQHEASLLLSSVASDAVHECHAQDQNLSEVTEPLTQPLLIPQEAASSNGNSDDHEQAKCDLVALCQRTVDLAFESAVRNVAVAKGIEDLQSLAVKFSLISYEQLLFQVTKPFPQG